MAYYLTQIKLLKFHKKTGLSSAYLVCMCSVVSGLSNPIDCSLPGYSVHGIFQARILEWVAISYSSGFQLKD